MLAAMRGEKVAKRKNLRGMVPLETNVNLEYKPIELPVPVGKQELR